MFYIIDSLSVSWTSRDFLQVLSPALWVGFWVRCWIEGTFASGLAGAGILW